MSGNAKPDSGSNTIRRGTRIGFLVGVGIAACWTKSILGFADHPIPAEDTGLYSMFATVYIAFGLVMFPVVMLMGGLAGRVLGSVVDRVWRRRNHERQ